MRETWDPVTIRGKRVYWVLTITFAGCEWHLSTAAMTIDRRDETSLQTIDALGPMDWERTLALKADSPGEDAIPFDIVVSEIDWGDLVARGFRLESATAELSRWVEGELWDDREVKLSGYLDEPGHAGPGEPVRFSLLTTPYVDKSSLIPAESVIDGVTWPGCPEEVLGNIYPTIIGSPGYLPDDPDTHVYGSPAYIVAVNIVTATLLIAGHWVASPTVWVLRPGVSKDGVLNNHWGVLIDEEAAQWAEVDVVNGYDGRGRKVAYCLLENGLGDAQFDSESHDPLGIQVSWPIEGGLIHPRGSGCIELAGDLLDHFLDRTTMRVDQGRTAIAAPLLRGYKIACYIDEPGTIWDWLRDNLIPILPVSIVTGAKGMYPLVIRIDPNRADIVDHLDCDNFEADLVGDITSTSATECANEITLSYAPDLENPGTYARTMTASGNEEDVTLALGRDRFRLAILRKSVDSFGVVAATPMTTSIVYDPITAAGIVKDQAYLQALVTRSFELLTDADRLHYEPGDLFLVTREEAGLVAQLCYVEQILDQDDGFLVLSMRTVER